MTQIQRMLLRIYAFVSLSLHCFAADESPSVWPGGTNNTQPQHSSTTEDNNYHYCSLCQGLAIVPNDKPFPDVPDSEDVTCGMMDLYFQHPDYVSQGFTGYVGLPPNVTGNHPGSCRADMLFNLAFESCCERSVPLWQCEQGIHELLLGEGSNYNPAVPPVEGRNKALNVSVFMQYESLEHMNVGEGTATIFVTMTLKWKDPRLAWEVEDVDTCANMIDVWTGHDVETSSIWLPSFDLLNQIEGIQSMPNFKANVYSDGTVHWYVSGGLNVFCAFTGLASIPFDTLGCQLLFGANARVHSSTINYILETPEYYFSGAFDVTYNEFTPVPELGDLGYAFDGDVIYFNVFFKRSTQHYIQNIVLPTVILTYLSFFTLLLDMRIGERLGFGMALALVVVAQQIVTSGMTPISDQALWLDKFVAWSFYWVLFGVVQSVFVGFLYFIRQDRKEKLEARNSQRAGGTAEEYEAINASKNHNNNDNHNHHDVSSTDTEEGPSMAVASGDAMVLVPDRESCTLHAAKVKSKNWLYTVRLRRLDFFCLLMAVTTYTIFIITMYWTGQSGSWLTNEPTWFHETSAQDFIQAPYDANDPNN